MSAAPLAVLVDYQSDLTGLQLGDWPARFGKGGGEKWTDEKRIKVQVTTKNVLLFHKRRTQIVKWLPSESFLLQARIHIPTRGRFDLAGGHMPIRRTSTLTEDAAWGAILGFADWPKDPLTYQNFRCTSGDHLSHSPPHSGGERETLSIRQMTAPTPLKGLVSLRTVKRALTA